jgi:hypothetical protein
MMELYAMGKFEKAVIKIGVAVLAFTIAGAIMAFPITWMWNGSLVPAVTFAKPIEWSTAWGIYMLAFILGHAATADFSDKSDK